MNDKYGKRPLYVCDSLIAVGDVHGDFDKLIRLIEQIELIRKKNEVVVFSGDLVDKGPYSLKVLRKCIELKKQFPNEYYFIMGNHDQMLLLFLQRGHRTFIETYGARFLEEMKEEYKISTLDYIEVRNALEKEGILQFLLDMIPYFETEDVLVTHAPLDRTVCLMYGIADYDEYYLEKKDDPHCQFFLERLGSEIKWAFTNVEEQMSFIKKFRICGHQPVYKTPKVFSDRAFVDTGCGNNNRPLSALMFPSKKIIQIK